MVLRPGRFAVLAMLCALLAGCAGFDDYADRRAWDATDLVRGHVMAGTGVDVKVECTRFVGCGGGGYSARAWGFVNRRFQAWHETIGDFALVLPKPALLANLHKESDFQGLDRVSGSYAVMYTEGSTGSSSLQDNPGPLLDWFTVRVTAFIFVGFDLELRVGEIADGIGGVFGWDPSGDDGLRS